MSENQFKTYLKSRNWSGIHDDFVNDALMDVALPDAKSWDELKSYLNDNSAVDGAITAAEYIWKLYVADNHGQVG